MVRSIILLAAALCAAPAVDAQALTAVNVSAPSINCLFSTTCRVTVSDVASPLLGSGFLQSRTYQAQPGSPAAGKWVYEYRVDLSKVTGAAAPPQVTSLAIPFGAWPVAMDFNGDGTATEKAFVVTGGALGTVGPTAVTQYGDTVYVSFATPTLNAGQSSYFIGLVSLNAPRAVEARVSTNLAGDVHLNARGPILGWETPPAAPAPSRAIAPVRARPGSRPAPKP